VELFQWGLVPSGAYVANGGLDSDQRVISGKSEGTLKWPTKLKTKNGVNGQRVAATRRKAHDRQEQHREVPNTQ
jgi:hypothetical protein